MIRDVSWLAQDAHLYQRSKLIESNGRLVERGLDLVEPSGHVRDSRPAGQGSAS